MATSTESAISEEAARQIQADLQRLSDEVARYKVRESTAAAADKILMDISQIIGGVQLIHRSVLTETPGVYMEFRLNNLRLSYTDRRTDVIGSGTLDISSVGEYQIIDFALDVAHDGLTVEQINRIERADYDTSWAGYSDNLAKYANCPQRLAEVYPQEVLDALEPELLGTAVSVDFFGSEEDTDADVLHIEAYRVLSNRSGITGKRIGEPEHDAAIIQLAEKFPRLHYLFGGPDNPSA